MPRLQQPAAAANFGGHATGDGVRYCYYCRCKHPPDQAMRRVDTPCGMRWRCRASIDAARQDAALRDAWGRTKTQANKSQDRRAAEHLGRLLREREFA